MNRLKTRVNRLTERGPVEPPRITIVRKIVDPLDMAREPNNFLCLDKDINITSRKGETMPDYIARIRELVGDRTVSILAV
jgi:hypothetical protein